MTKQQRKTAPGYLAALVGGAAILGLTALSAHAQAPKPEAEVVLAGYGGTIEQFIRNKVIPGFEKATGIKVKLVVGTALSNYSKVLATRERPEIDVYWSNELTHIAGKQQGLYVATDPKIVTNLPDIFTLAKDPDGIGVASYVTDIGIQYNVDKFKEAGLAPPTSWFDLWDPKFKGKVALYSFGIAFSQDLVALMTRLTGGDEKNIDKAIAKIKELKTSGNAVVFANTPAEMDNIMNQGQAWMTYNVGLRALIQRAKGAPLEYVQPKEGGIFFTNYFDVVKNAPHPVAAQMLVDYLMRPDVQTEISEGLAVAPINRKATVAPSLVGKVPFGDEALGKLVRIDRAEMNKHLDEWAERWNREIESRR